MAAPASLPGTVRSSGIGAAWQEAFQGGDFRWPPVEIDGDQPRCVQTLVSAIGARAFVATRPRAQLDDLLDHICGPVAGPSIIRRGGRVVRETLSTVRAPSQRWPPSAAPDHSCAAFAFRSPVRHPPRFGPAPRPLSLFFCLLSSFSLSGPSPFSFFFLPFFLSLSSLLFFFLFFVSVSFPPSSLLSPFFSSPLSFFFFPFLFLSSPLSLHLRAADDASYSRSQSSGAASCSVWKEVVTLPTAVPISTSESLVSSPSADAVSTSETRASTVALNVSIS